MADSAGATKVRFTLDWRLQKGESLLTQPMAKLQGSGSRVKRRMDEGLDLQDLSHDSERNVMIEAVSGSCNTFVMETLKRSVWLYLQVLPFTLYLTLLSARRSGKAQQGSEWCLRIEDKSVVLSVFLKFHPYRGEESSLTNIFQLC